MNLAKLAASIAPVTAAQMEAPTHVLTPTTIHLLNCVTYAYAYAVLYYII